MIAIMILGLGMVMVATVFPVSLDITRGTLQLSIAQTAADVAVSTIELRVPRVKPELDGDPNTATPATSVGRVGLGDMVARELLGGLAVIDANDYSVKEGLPSPRLGVFYPFPLDLAHPEQPLDATHTLLVRIYSEWTFLDAEKGPVTGGLPSFVINAQNSRPNGAAMASYGRWLEDNPPCPYLVTGYTQSPARISIADRVYPPMEVVVDSTNPALLLRPTMDEFISRRYSWTAIHFRDTNDQAQKTFFCRIVVLYRGSTSATYPKQAFNLDPTTWNAPVPEPTDANDTVLPQAWLVSLDSINATTGTVTCTPQIAALLPTGSQFIVAADPNSRTTGAYVKVLRNDWRIGETSATLSIKPGELTTNVNVPVWVFPPAIQSAPTSNRQLTDPTMATYLRLEKTSPVVDVIPRKLVAG